MKATFTKYILNFKRPSGTSRGVLKTKETWFVILEHEDRFGIGECAIFRGLSYDDVPQFEQTCNWVTENMDLGLPVLLHDLQNFPSIQFGLEQAFLSLNSDNPFKLFDSSFVQNNHPIAINGLIWMGDSGYMKEQISDKLEKGFNCIKLKIGAIDFKEELRLLESVRKEFDADTIELRVDANGAFTPKEALLKLTELSQFQLHSIEQPIRQGNWEQMRELCEETPLPIALDEELVGITDVTKKKEMLLMVQPQFIILKPSLVGGFSGSKQWMEIANDNGIGWWVTSALESNIGLNAIAQWTATLGNTMPQGLGTGSLFTNNFDSPLKVQNGGLFYDNEVEWETNLIENLCI